MFGWVRKRLSTKDVAILRLSLWAALVAWMVFFVGYGVVLVHNFITGKGMELLHKWFEYSTWGHVVSWIIPVWVIFTALLVCVYVARFVNRRFRRPKLEFHNEDQAQIEKRIFRETTDEKEK